MWSRMTIWQFTSSEFAAVKTVSFGGGCGLASHLFSFFSPTQGLFELFRRK